jgi:ribosomal protein L40E
MTRANTFTSALAAALALTACAKAGSDAPWLTMPTAEEHAARFFPVNAGTPHATAQCDDCHGAFDTFRQFDCVGCHDGSHADEPTVASWHTDVPDFAFTSAACYGCHADGRGAFANHGAFFPIDAGTKHATAGCSSCHLDRANRLLLGCAGCHGHAQATAAAQHALVRGYQFDSALCVRCHADGQVDRIAAHQPFLIASGARHAAPDAGECLRCHAHDPGPAGERDPAMRADKPWAADFGVFTCVDCHVKVEVDQRHLGSVAGYEYTTPKCRNCHPTGKGGD